jgi:DNA-binding transcriptional ArsR family regulator
LPAPVPCERLLLTRNSRSRIDRGCLPERGSPSSHSGRLQEQSRFSWMRFFDFKPLRRVIDYLLNISEKSVTLPTMILEQLKALGSDTRMQMMEWLKDPLSNFPPQDHGDPAKGVCVTHLQHKAGLSPSTASAHLAILQRAGFVLTTRIGKWTYYRRNEQAIDDFAARLIIEL